jgi:hypothetical protein
LRDFRIKSSLVSNNSVRFVVLTGASLGLFLQIILNRKVRRCSGVKQMLRLSLQLWGLGLQKARAL